MANELYQLGLYVFQVGLISYKYVLVYSKYTNLQRQLGFQGIDTKGQLGTWSLDSKHVVEVAKL
jgi:hypothetical protein